MNETNEIDVSDHAIERAMQRVRRGQVTYAGMRELLAAAAGDQELDSTPSPVRGQRLVPVDLPGDPGERVYAVVGKTKDGRSRGMAQGVITVLTEQQAADLLGGSVPWRRGRRRR